ncbi:hypothetical protein KC678_04445 [Candidatus Dojkabacteria bacterium]|uniref:Uncharacterized protein n=1 Tax=Candidatus Dojkabacteria bacterium TaxID=2099670 RepID=A0A955L232_9BACT|nr:hypothetical protein [Candidatus Dojkabacteria bacterium]
MASLYQNTQRTRKIIVGVLIFFVLVLLFNLYRNLTAEPLVDVIPNSQRFYVNPNRIFGDVPSPEIPGIEYNQDATFSLDGIHFLNDFPDVAFVYAIEQPRERLLSISEAQDTATALGFVGSSYTKSGTVLTWLASNGTKTLTYDLASRKWSLETRFLDNEAALARKNLLDGNNLVELESAYEKLGSRIISGFKLTGLGLDDVDVNATIAQKGIDGFLTEVNKLADAEYVHMAISRVMAVSALKPRSEQPEGVAPEAPEPVKVYSDDPRDGQITLLISNQLKSFATDVFEFNFTDFEYDELSTGIYSIITPDEAWSNVQKGQGALTFIEKQDSNYFAEYSSVNVRRFNAVAQQTELALYEPDNWYGYAIPIYVFRGTAQLEDGQLANFIFYADAIKRVI